MRERQRQTDRQYRDKQRQTDRDRVRQRQILTQLFNTFTALLVTFFQPAKLSSLHWRSLCRASQMSVSSLLFIHPKDKSIFCHREGWAASSDQHRLTLAALENKRRMLLVRKSEKSKDPNWPDW